MGGLTWSRGPFPAPERGRLLLVVGALGSRVYESGRTPGRWEWWTGGVYFDVELRNQDGLPWMLIDRPEVGHG